MPLMMYKHTDKMSRRVGFENCFLRVPALLPTALLPRQGKGITQYMRHFVTW